MTPDAPLADRIEAKRRELRRWKDTEHALRIEAAAVLNAARHAAVRVRLLFAELNEMEEKP